MSNLNDMKADLRMPARKMPARSTRQKSDRSAAGTQEILDVLGAPTAIRCDPMQVQMLVAERTFPPGHRTPIQAQNADDELVYVLEGEIKIIDEDREILAGPGVCLATPRGHARAYHNDGAIAAKGLIIAQPGIQTAELFRNLDRASRAARAAGRLLSQAEAGEIASQYGAQFRWP